MYQEDIVMKKLSAIFLVLGISGFLLSGCIISSGGSPCDGITCDNFGTCIEVGGDAECTCDNGYKNDGPLHCVAAGSSIDLDWSFGPGGRSCDDAYVDKVRVQMFSGNTEILNQEVACSNGGAVIDAVEDGTYSIDLTGLSAAGDEWYTTTEDVTVSGQNVELGTVILTPTGPGDMKFVWEFGAGLDCTAAGVSRVRVEVYDSNSNLEFEADPVPHCDELGASITNFALGTWNLVLEGICDSDLSVGYKLDANLVIAHPDDNDYGTVTLEDVGGCQ